MYSDCFAALRVSLSSSHDSPNEGVLGGSAFGVSPARKVKNKRLTPESLISKFMKNGQFHNTLTVRNLPRVFMRSFRNRTNARPYRKLRDLYQVLLIKAETENIPSSGTFRVSVGKWLCAWIR